MKIFGRHFCALHGWPFRILHSLTVQHHGLHFTFCLAHLSRSSRLSKFSHVQRNKTSQPTINEKWRTLTTVTSACLSDGSTKYFDFVVIGSGVAGLRYALEVAKHGSVAVITKAEPHESNTNYAQGGVSAVLCPSDSVESHVQDTIVAGAHLCDEETVRVCFAACISYIHTF